MAAKLETTNTPGVFKRHVGGCPRTARCECAYVATWRAHGRQHTETHRTLAEAREAKRAHESDAARGEFDVAARTTLHSYARDWVERYQGTGRRGFREETRQDYRRNIERYVLRYFSSGLKLSELSPRMVADYIGWLVRQKAKGREGATLSDSSVRNAFKPLAACLATARREGLIRHNPASEAVLPHRPQVQDDEELVRPFPLDDEGRPVMELVVELVHPRHRLMFALLAATGLRRSELLALEGRHLVLPVGRPFVKVRQRVRRQTGKGLVIGSLKSRYARRDVPVPLGLADRLATLMIAPGDLVFTSARGTMLDPDNLFDRVLRPACEGAGVEWAGFHTFRHTVASRLFAGGRNAVQVQRWLGHHSPSFTLDTYVHLLDGDLGDPLEALQVNEGSTERPETAARAEASERLKEAA